MIAVQVSTTGACGEGVHGHLLVARAILASRQAGTCAQAAYVCVSYAVFVPSRTTCGVRPIGTVTLSQAQRQLFHSSKKSAVLKSYIRNSTRTQQHAKLRALTVFRGLRQHVRPIERQEAGSEDLLDMAL